MKTNQLMKRKMGEFNVTQRTKDGFFCATELLRQWNEYANLNRGNFPYLLYDLHKGITRMIIFCTRI